MASSESRPSRRIRRRLLWSTVPLLVASMVVTTGIAGICGLEAYRRAAGLESFASALSGYRWIVLMTILAEGVFLAVGIWVVDRLSRRIGGLTDGMEDLVRAVLHDLQTPLAQMRHQAESLAAGGADCGEAAGAIAEHCDQLISIVEMNAEIGQIAASDSVAAFPVNLSATLNLAIELFSAVAVESGVELVYEPPRGSVVILAQTARVQRFLSNLVDNAIKFTPRGGRVRVTLTTAGRMAVLVVADSGVGMDAETKERIFDRFYRADSSRGKPGFGLGLSLVHAIVRHYHWTIRCESAPGVGTTFIVEFPLADEKAVAEAEAAAAVKKENGLRA